MDILSEIIAHKRTEVELQKQSVSPEQLREQVQKLMGSSSAPRHSMRTGPCVLTYGNHCRVQAPFPLERLDI